MTTKKIPFNYDINRMLAVDLIAIIHIDDYDTRFLELTLFDDGTPFSVEGCIVTSRFVTISGSYLLSDNVPCEATGNTITIPIDAAAVQMMACDIKIEVNIVDGEKILTLPFPLWVRVRGSILETAHVTPESQGTIPELLEAAQEALDAATAALEDAGDYSKLDNKPQINGHTLSGNKASDELGLQNKLTAGENVNIDANGNITITGVTKYRNVPTEQVDDCIENGVLYSLYISGLQSNAQIIAHNNYATITQHALLDDGRLMYRMRQGETPWQPAGEWSAWESIGGSQIVSGVVNQNGTITFTDSDGQTFTTSGSSVIGDDGFSPTATVTQTASGATVSITDKNGTTTANISNGAPGQDYVLTPQDKTDIAGMVDISGKADKATTLAGYGITDAYTKTQTDTFFSDTNADIADLKAYIGYTDGDILGLHADFENKVFTRLGAAVGLTAGQDFNAFTMYGGRRRCCVSNDGTINAYYGEQDYVEDGSNGQVMVYQPKFYYCMVPLKLEKQASGLGYHIRKANYYVTANPHPGFKLHPLFYDANGNEVDYVLLSAYEGSMYDVSESAYVNDGVDTSVSYGAGDLLCSVAGKKPISGKLSGVGTRANFETMANNIGSGWHLNTIKAESANQLLMLIELGRFNTQAAIGQGVVSCPSNGSYNCSSYTGSTASLGNATGMATETTYESAGTETVNTTNGKLSVTYRGVENPWGNIWKHTNGINLWGDGHMGGGQVFICDDFSFNESKHDGNYQSAGFTISNGNGYVSAFGYGDEEFDWLFMPSETTGNSSLPVGDNYWCQPNLNGYRIARLGGRWGDGDGAGGFYRSCNDAPGVRGYGIGGRLLYVPTAAGFGSQGAPGNDYVLTAQDKSDIADIVLAEFTGSIVNGELNTR